jgi:hypothetical protein
MAEVAAERPKPSIAALPLGHPGGPESKLQHVNSMIGSRDRNNKAQIIESSGKWPIRCIRDHSAPILLTWPLLNRVVELDIPKPCYI